MASLEKRIVASVLKSREAAEKIFDHVHLDTLTAYSVLLLNIAKEFYRRDRNSNKVDIEHIADKVDLKIENPNKRSLYVDYARECLAVDISPINVAELLLETKRKESAALLAQTLANADSSDASVIAKIDAHRELLSTTDSGEDNDDREILHNISVEQINKQVLSKDGQIKLLSKQFTDHIGGGALRGHHIGIVARPETGKTATVLSMARSLVMQKLPGAYFGNEDPVLSIIERFQGCLSGIPRLDRLRDPPLANKTLQANGYEYITFYSISPGTCEEIDQYCKEEKPDWIIVDQLRNLRCRAENRTNQFEIIATDLRNIAKRRNCLVISVTQAGDSATDKLVLEMGDIDGSNTGIPAQMDLIVGLGLNKEFYANKQLMISLPKNKLSGQHVHWPMSINRDLSRVEDI